MEEGMEAEGQVVTESGGPETMTQEKRIPFISTLFNKRNEKVDGENYAWRRFVYGKVEDIFNSDDSPGNKMASYLGLITNSIDAHKDQVGAAIVLARAGRLTGHNEISPKTDNNPSGTPTPEDWPKIDGRTLEIAKDLASKANLPEDFIEKYMLNKKVVE